MKAGIIDLGSNSCRLLVAKVKGQHLNTLLTQRKPTRLGQGIQEQRLQPLAMERSWQAIQEFWQLSQELGVEKSLISATAAVREAKNQAQFLELVYQKIGQKIRVLSGAEEAFWGYQGVKLNFSQIDEPVIMDLGGGSTEFSWTQGANLACISTKVGVVRMLENSAEEAEILAALEPALSRIKAGAWGQPLIAIGGTATTLAALALAQESYHDQQGYLLSLSRIEEIQQKINRLSLDERRQLPGLSPDRADVMPVGLQIITLIMRELGQKELQISNTGLMHGLALSLETDIPIKNVLTYG